MVNRLNWGTGAREEGNERPLLLAGVVFEPFRGISDLLGLAANFPLGCGGFLNQVTTILLDRQPHYLAAKRNLGFHPADQPGLIAAAAFGQAAVLQFALEHGLQGFTQ